MVSDESQRLWVEAVVDIFQNHNHHIRNVTVRKGFETITEKVALSWGYELLSQELSTSGVFVFQTYKLRKSA